MVTFTDTVTEPLTLSQPSNIAQYHWTLTQALTMSLSTNTYSWRTTRVIQDLIQWSESTAQEIEWHTVARDTIGMSVAFLRLYRSETITQAMTIAQTSAYYSYATRILQELLSISQIDANGLKFAGTLTQDIEISEVQKAVRGLTMTQGFTIADVPNLYEYVRIIESLSIADAVSMPWRVSASVSEQLELLDALSRFLGARIDDVMAVVEALSYKYFMYPALAETVQITDTLSRGLLLRIVANDTIEIDHNDAIKMLFRPILDEVVEIVSMYLDPEGITTWTVNLAHGGVTEYTNYNFNSFARVGNNYIAASADGLYELDGADDAGTDIITRLKSGMLQFGKSNYSSFKGVYLGARGGGDWVLKLVTGDGKSYTYSVEARTMETTKVNIGKGLRARYFSFELISTGQDFDLDSIEFIPIVARRRV